jgi:superfamily II RNA helicase
MTGRAGRRGLDDEGHAVVCFANETSMNEIGRVALSPAPDLHSSFRPTYNLTANLIHHFDRETAEVILHQSYAQFEADRSPSGPRRSLVELMQARHGVLEELGFADGWSLTDAGRRLRSLYHECDLMVASTVDAGILDDAEPSAVAAILSAFVFESRRVRRSGPHRATPPTKRRPRNDRLGEVRRGDISERMRELFAQAAAVTVAEDRHHVAHPKEPDGAFGPTIAAWVRGAPLSTTLEIAEADTGQFSPGDFVRNAKQVADLLEQVSRIASSAALQEACEEARRQIVRGVVAGSSTIPATRDGAA